MTRAKQLRQSIQTELEAACGIRFFSEFAPPWVKPPFGVYSLLLLRRGEASEEYDLLVNIADSGTDETRVEELAELAARRLDCLDYFGADGTAWGSWLNSCQPIDHGDTTIYQRRLNFTVKYY